jgi:hypothetical protein
MSTRYSACLLHGILIRAVLACYLFTLPLVQTAAQIDANERAFPQSKTAIEKALKSMQASLAGRLPVLDGFADADHPGNHSLDRYQRGYYQATVQMSAAPTGGLIVRFAVKVTAWYSDPVGARSGYQLLNSNGRIEADLLDQLQEQLVKEEQLAKAAIPGNREEKAAPPPAAASLSRPTSDRNEKAAIPQLSDKVVQPSDTNLSSVMNQTLSAEERAVLRPSENTPSKSDNKLQVEVQSLEEILKNQAHPNNLVAVKKSGTPVVPNPTLSAKPLFLASAHDEFEMLEFNRDWVHVRISGLSRGWIWRNSLEMPDGIPDTTAQSGSATSLAADLFRVTREETAPFPGDWPPLRGKNVKILSVQKVDEAHAEGNSQDKLAYAKFLLDKTYGEMRGKPDDLAGIVLIFDSADGGMIAAALPTLQQWKAGTMSDAAFWHNCFFDPPETFDSASSSGTQ